MAINRKEININFCSDIAFQPIISEIQKNSEIFIKVASGRIDQHFQMMAEDLAGDVFILNYGPGFFLKETNYDAALSFAHDFAIAAREFLRNSPAWLIINNIWACPDSLIFLDNVRAMRLVNEINKILIDLSLGHPRVRLVDVAGVINSIGLDNATSRQNELAMGVPYRKAAINSMAKAYSEILSQIYLPRKKVLILDADNTLWGGVVGEDGIDGIKIGHDYPGSVYHSFQRQLLKARDSGLLLALVSKNNERDVLEAFSSLDMPLKFEHFAVTRVNWESKSKNILEIASTLNIGLESIAFIDDSYFEIEEVKHALPMVDCYRFYAGSPDDALTLLSRMQHISAWSITEEDTRKSQQYEEEAQRKALLANSKSTDEYLVSLGVSLQYGVNRRSQTMRIAQLTNKTNQFNLTTRRYSEIEIEQLMLSARVYDFRVADKYGDMGIVGVCIVEHNMIKSFLISCRALGREIESTMLKIVCEDNLGVDLEAEYIKTEKNSMTECFFDKNGFDLIWRDSNRKHYKLGRGPVPRITFPCEKV